MIYTAYIHIWNKTVGAVAWNEETGVSAFEFEPDFLESKWDISPIKLPINHAKRKVYTYKELRNTSLMGLPGFLADMLPGKFALSLINYWLIHQQKPEKLLNPIEQLNFVGKRGKGALEIEPALGGSGSISTNLDMNELQNVVDIFLNSDSVPSIERNSRNEQHFFELLKICSSTVSDIPQALITFNTDTEEIRSGQLYAPEGFEHWIFNFNTNANGMKLSVPRIRMALYNMARESGIDVAQSRLIEKGAKTYFLCKRIDRSGKSDKIHTLSLGALQHYDTNNNHVFSYEQVFETMRLLRLPYLQAEQMFRRVVYNVLINNIDENLSTINFRMNEFGNWMLAPFTPMIITTESLLKKRHSLSVNGKFMSIKRKDLLALGQQMSIKKATYIIDEIEDVIKNWPYYAENQEVPFEQIKTISERLG